MCGIAGIVDFTGATPSEARIAHLTALQRHRGPDGQGLLRRDGVALGHRRLSIIDLAGGQQPLANETGDIFLTFNGEIYNFASLRRELFTLGHVFRSQSDSEVIVHAYEQWGESCVTRFRGMFAFAIADFRQRKLFLARDPFGIKPLFYRIESNYLAFASELAPLLSLEPTAPPVHLQAIDFYLRYRYIPAPHTAYERILRLPPAHTWSGSFDGRSTGPREYWRLKLQEDGRASNSALTDQQWLEQFSEVLEESVAAHLVSDVPLGAFLSGGVDSTLIVATMARQLGQNVHAFSIGFDDADYSELPFARQAAASLGVQLHTEIVRPDIEQILDELCERYGEPFADTSAIPTWCVARLARQHVTVALSGDGADEAFAGYPRYDAFVRGGVRRDLFDLLRNPRRALRQLAARMAGTWPDRLQRWQSRHVGVLDAAARHALWRPEYRHITAEPCSAFSGAHQDARRLSTLRYGQYLDLKTYLPGDILTKVDIASMCHGLEVRTPFTDLRVMEFAATLPQRWLRQTRPFGPATLKPLLKQTLPTRFSSDFVHRRKQGFAIPEANWLRPGTPLRRRLDGLLDQTDGPLTAWFLPERMQEMRREFDERGRHATSLWLLMILGIWTERHAQAGCARVAA